MKVDLEKYREYIETRIAEGASLRMLENEIGIERQKLSREMKKAGMRVPTRIESVKFLWKNHKHPHIGKTGSLCPTYGRKMSDETKQKLREAMAGDKNYHWSGGRKKHSSGYILVYRPDNQLADKHGFVLEHRLVAEQKYGRKLTSSDIVHHIDGNKTNNNPENIVVLTRSEHAKLHNGLKKCNKRRNTSA